MRIKTHLEEGKMAKSLVADEEEAVLISHNLLTAKPVIYAANVKEEICRMKGKANNM